MGYGLRWWQRVKEENVAQAVSAWLRNLTLSLWRWPSVPPDCDVGGWLVWPLAACRMILWNV